MSLETKEFYPVMRGGGRWFLTWYFLPVSGSSLLWFHSLMRHSFYLEPKIQPTHFHSLNHHTFDCTLNLLDIYCWIYVLLQTCKIHHMRGVGGSAADSTTHSNGVTSEPTGVMVSTMRQVRNSFLCQCLFLFSHFSHLRFAWYVVGNKSLTQKAFRKHCKCYHFSQSGNVKSKCDAKWAAMGQSPSNKASVLLLTNVHCFSHWISFINYRFAMHVNIYVDQRGLCKWDTCFDNRLATNHGPNLLLHADGEVLIRLLSCVFFSLLLWINQI